MGGIDNNKMKYIHWCIEGSQNRRILGDVVFQSQQAAYTNIAVANIGALNIHLIPTILNKSELKFQEWTTGHFFSLS